MPVNNPLYFDATNPTTSAVGDAAATGSAFVPAQRDHVHGRESFATNALLLGTAAAAGGATTPMRSNDTIAAFDTTVPTTQAFGDSAATGSVAFAARRDHKHGMPSDPNAVTTAVHGLPASTGVLGNRDATGEFIHRGAQAFSYTAGAGGTTINVTTAGAATTFAVAFPTAVAAIALGGVNTSTSILLGLAGTSLTTSGITMIVLAVASGSVAGSGYYIAVGN